MTMINSYPALVAVLTGIFMAVMLLSFYGLRIFVPKTVKAEQSVIQKPFALWRVITKSMVQIGQGGKSVLGPFTPKSLLEEDWQGSSWHVKLLNAGYRTYTSALAYFASKLLLAVTLPFILIVAAPFLEFHLHAWVYILVIVVAGFIGYFAPNFYLWVRTRRRKSSLLNSFPDALDLMRVCLEAGMGLDAAILRVGEELKLQSPTLHDEFHLVSLELRAGSTRNLALRNLATRTGLAEIEALVAMLIQSERFGTSVAESIRVHSDQLRFQRKIKAEEFAAKISTKLLFPLIFCIFPALLLVLLGPAGIMVHENLSIGAPR
jgi:tight adherence protein C